MTQNKTSQNNETASEQTAKENEVPANNLFNMFETMKEVLTQERYKDKSIMKMKL
jgi:phytoene/squalene synthetase